MKLSRNRWMAIVIAVIVAADWATKALVQQRISFHDRHTIVEGWLSLTHSINRGISWGLFNDGEHSGLRMALLIGVTLVGIGATASIIWGSRDRWIHIAGALVLGGALGNLGDRVLDGGVTDFIYVHFFPYIFNVADIAISIGGVLLVARMLLDGRGGEKPSAPTAA